MMSVEMCSRRFDFLRLHRRAWDHKLIRKPRSMDQAQIANHVRGLLRALCGSLLKEYGLAFDEFQECESVRFQMPAMAAWLDHLKETSTLPLAPQLSLPTKDTPYFRLVCIEGRVSCAFAQYEAFAHDLKLLSELAQEREANALEQGKPLDVPSPFGQVLPKKRKTRKAQTT